MKALDLFCGAGGATLGLAQAGYSFSVLGYDMWDAALTTHRNHFGPAVKADLNTVDWSDTETPEVLHGSPPCPPFSLLGRAMRGSDDPRDGTPAFLRAVAELRPPLVTMENVKGLSFAKSRPYLESILDELRNLGYTAEWSLLNAADYGVPQTRIRLFIIATLNGDPVWPKPTHGDGLQPWVTMAEALGWHPDGVWPMDRVNDQSCSGIGLDWTLTRPATTVAGRNLIGAPGANANRFNRATKSRNDGVFVTEDEAAVLQGFPRGIEWAGNQRDRFLQIGNAVPPPMMKAVVEANVEANGAS